MKKEKDVSAIVRWGIKFGLVSIFSSFSLIPLFFLSWEIVMFGILLAIVMIFGPLLGITGLILSFIDFRKDRNSNAKKGIYLNLIGLALHSSYYILLLLFRFGYLGS